MLAYVRKYLPASLKGELRRMSYYPRVPLDILFCAIKGLQWDATWRFDGLPLVYAWRRGSIQIGKRFKAISRAQGNVLGVSQRVTLKVFGADASLKIGDDVGISGSSIACNCGIRIGDRVLIGSGCLITDSDWHGLEAHEREDPTAVKSVPVVIEDDVFIGARSIILRGSTIGARSVIGAGSVVVGEIPADVIAAGNPARVVKQLSGSLGGNAAKR